MGHTIPVEFVLTSDVVERFYTLSAPQLNVDRLRVTVLTDIHFAPSLPAAYFDRVLTLVAKEQPDLILLTGDYASRAANLTALAKYSSAFLTSPVRI